MEFDLTSPFSFWCVPWRSSWRAQRAAGGVLRVRLSADVALAWNGRNVVLGFIPLTMVQVRTSAHQGKAGFSALKQCLPPPKPCR